jgi:hypothetical protein
MNIFCAYDYVDIGFVWSWAVCVLNASLRHASLYGKQHSGRLWAATYEADLSYIYEMMKENYQCFSVAVANEIAISCEWLQEVIADPEYQ